MQLKLLERKDMHHGQSRPLIRLLLQMKYISIFRQFLQEKSVVQILKAKHFVSEHIMSVTYMQAGVEKIKNVIPQICKFGGTMRTTKRETMEKMAVELKNELRAICEVYGATYKSDIKIHGGAVENSPILLDQVREAAGEILGQEQSYIIEGDNLGGENFSEYRFQDYTVLYINLMTAFWQMHQVYLQCLGIRDVWEC